MYGSKIWRCITVTGFIDKLKLIKLNIRTNLIVLKYFMEKKAKYPSKKFLPSTLEACLRSRSKKTLYLDRIQARVQLENFLMNKINFLNWTRVKVRQFC